MKIGKTNIMNKLSLESKNKIILKWKESERWNSGMTGVT